MQTLNIILVLWVAVTNANPMSVSQRLTNLEHKLDLMHELVSPTTNTVTEADDLVTEDDEEPESNDVAEEVAAKDRDRIEAAKAADRERRAANGRVSELDVRINRKGGRLDLSDELVAKLTQNLLRSCAHVKSADLCGHSLAKKACAATCA